MAACVAALALALSMVLATPASAATTSGTYVSAPKAAYGTGLVVKAKVVPGYGRTIYLQKKVGTAWKNVTSKKTVGKKTATVTFPTVHEKNLGTHGAKTRWRVRAPKHKSLAAKTLPTFTVTHAATTFSGWTTSDTVTNASHAVTFNVVRPAGRKILIQQHVGGSWVTRKTVNGSTKANATQKVTATLAKAQLAGPRRVNVTEWRVRAEGTKTTNAVNSATKSVTYRTEKQIVIGHRGASGYRPEHTIASYELAIKQCADYIEPDLVLTKDGVLVARHENEISGTTDVADRTEFADRKTTKTIGGTKHTGWFAEDFTLAELKTLRAKERLPEARPASRAYDGEYQIPTFAEVLDLARNSRACAGKPVGVAPEMKNPDYFTSIGKPIEPRLVADLKAKGLNSATSPIWVQSFQGASLQTLNKLTPVRITMLVSFSKQVTSSALKHIAAFADGVAPTKNLVISRKPDGSLGAATTLVRNAHAVGLEVQVWTIRRENQFLPTNLRSSTDANAAGNMKAEAQAFFKAGVDGLFTDNPDLAHAARGT